MKNKKVLLLIVAGVMIGGFGGGMYLWSKQVKTEAPPTVVASPTATDVPVELVTWTDPAGFTFQYPKDVDINPHDEDKVNYAHVELTHKNHPGSVIVWMKDLPAGQAGLPAGQAGLPAGQAGLPAGQAGLPAPDLAGWIKKETRFTGASVLDTTLGGEPAKKVLVTDPLKMIIVGAIDVDVLVTVEGLLTDDTYWSSLHKGIVDSFVFSQSSTKTGSSSVSSGDSGDSNVTEEEVLE